MLEHGDLARVDGGPRRASAADRRRRRAPRRRSRRPATSTASRCSTWTTCAPSPTPGMAERRREVAAVRRMVDEEVVRFTAVTTAQEVAPLVAALHERGEVDPRRRARALPRPAGRARRPPGRGGRGADPRHRGQAAARADRRGSRTPPARPGASAWPRRCATCSRSSDGAARAPSATARTGASCASPPGAARWPAGRPTHVAALLPRRRPGGRRSSWWSSRPRATATSTCPIWEMGGKGVFVKEVQAAVLDGRADVAVHSAKDLPAVTHAGPGDRRRCPSGPTPATRWSARPSPAWRPGARGGDRIGAPAGPAGRAAPRPHLRRAARQHRHPAGPGRRVRRDRHGRRRARAPRARPTGSPRSSTPSVMLPAGRPGRAGGRVPGRRRRGPRASSAAIEHRPSRAGASRPSAASWPSSAATATCRPAAHATLVRRRGPAHARGSDRLARRSRRAAPPPRPMPVRPIRERERSGRVRSARRSPATCWTTTVGRPARPLSEPGCGRAASSVVRLYCQ